MALKQVESHIIHSGKTLMALLSPLIATWHDTAKQDPFKTAVFVVNCFAIAKTEFPDFVVLKRTEVVRKGHEWVSF